MHIEKKHISVVALALLGIAGLGWVAATQVLVTSWDFRNNLWGPAYLLLQHRSPYNVSVLFTNSNAVWFPPVIGFLSPLFGLLSLQTATNIWLMLNLSLLTFMVWLVAISESELEPKLKLRCFAIGLGLVFLFPPTVTQLVLGQYTIISMVLFLTVARLITRNNKIRGLLISGAVLSLAFAKPQLLLLVLPGLFIASYRFKGGYKGVAGLGGGLLAGIGLSTLPFWIGYPGWLDDFFTALHQNPQWEQPSILHTLQLTLGAGLGFLLWGLLTIIIFGLNIRLWFTLPPAQAVVWSLALTVLVSPYVWSWDFVLLLPLIVYFIATAFKANHKAETNLTRGVILVSGGYAVCWFGIIWQRLNTDGNDQIFWWIPIAILAINGLGNWLMTGGFSVQRFDAKSSPSNRLS